MSATAPITAGSRGVGQYNPLAIAGLIVGLAPLVQLGIGLAGVLKFLPGIIVASDIVAILLIEGPALISAIGARALTTALVLTIVHVGVLQPATALGLGIGALCRIRRSPKRQRGARVALLGIVAGAAASALTLIACAAIFYLLSGSME